MKKTLTRTAKVSPKVARAATVSAKIARLTKRSIDQLTGDLSSIFDAADAEPGIVFRSGRDTVEDRCNQYQAGLGALGAAADLVEATEDLTGADLSDSKGKIESAKNDLNGRRDALGCS